jgi:hypothetical protein
MSKLTDLLNVWVIVLTSQVDGVNCLKLWDSNRSAKFMSHSVFCFSIFCCCRFWKFQLIHKYIKVKRMFFYCRTWSFWNIFFQLTQILKESLWFCLLVLFVHVLIITLLLSLALKNELMDFNHLRTATSDVKYCFCTSLSLCLSNFHSTSIFVTSTILVNSVEISLSVNMLIYLVILCGLGISLSQDLHTENWSADV